jgi:MFS family permease
VIWSVLRHSELPASRLIWIYAIGIGAFMGTMAIIALFLAKQFGVTAQTIGYFFFYVAVLNIFARLVLLGPLVDRLGEVRLSRIGVVVLAVGLALIPLSHNLYELALATALVPLGTSFTFPCVTAMLSHVIAPEERGLYMGTQQTFGGVTRALFPLGAGYLWDHFVPGAPFWAGATLVAATLFLSVNLKSYVSREPSGVTPGTTPGGLIPPLQTTAEIAGVGAPAGPVASARE